MRRYREYLKKRVDLAIDAGADALMYDNNFGGHLVDLYQDIYRYGAARKKDFMIMGNFHQNSYVLNRLTNCMTTEDGAEPGVYEEAHLQGRRGRLDAAALVPVDHGRLVTNVGLFRICNALSAGVLYNIVQQPATGRTIIHFLNYTLKPSAEIKVVSQRKYARVSLLSPDSPQAVQLSIPPGVPAELKVPSVRLYSLLVLETHIPSSVKVVAKH